MDLRVPLACFLILMLAPIGVAVDATYEAEITLSDLKADDWMGTGVAVSQGRILVSSPGFDGSASQTGRLDLFQRSGSQWVGTTIPVPFDTAGDHFGRSVDMDGARAIVGAPRDDISGAVDAGSAYVATITEDGWAASQLVAADPSTGAKFGLDVAISGDYAVIGAPSDPEQGDAAGAAYVFERSSGLWAQVAKLHGEEGQARAHFGWSVAIAGETIVVGAPMEDSPKEDAGAAYVFQRGSGSWDLAARLVPASSNTQNWFGWDVTISGDRLAVGEPRGDPGGKTNAGHAFVYRRDGGNWVQETALAHNDNDPDDNLGFAVSLRGTLLAVGAPGIDTSQTGLSLANHGAVFLFEHSGGSWSQADMLDLAGAKRAEDNFGGGGRETDTRLPGSIDLGTSRLAVGVPTRDKQPGSAPNHGATYVWRTGSNEFPTAHIDVDCTALVCEFDASGSTDPDGMINAYAWDFGHGGATAIGETVSHEFPAEGTYEVTLTVTDDEGAQSTAAQTVPLESGSGASTSVTTPPPSSQAPTTTKAAQDDDIVRVPAPAATLIVAGLGALAMLRRRLE